MFYQHPKNNCLLTDFYQYTMAQALFDNNRHLTKSVFHLFFRKNPFLGNWALTAGIEDALSFIEDLRFDEESLDYLASCTTKNGRRLFSDEFLSFLRSFQIKIDVSGVKDGEVIFPFEPILRVEGPLFLCQLLETPLLNIINFQTLIATKAARIKLAARNKIVMDFGLRRAQGFDGAISATKASFIGGIDATSNVWAGKHFDIPTVGTQSHSFIMSYADEQEAFDDFALSFFDNCVLLVDTYQPVEGINRAIKTFQSLKKRGVLGVRIDSGDLFLLSQMARRMLNQAGLHDCKIIVSGDLDENAIKKLEDLNAPIDRYGVGTRLVTAHDDPALGGVFKLSAILENGLWRDAFKPTAQKTSLPGPQAIARFFEKESLAFDVIFNPRLGLNHSYQNTLKPTFLHEKLMIDGQRVQRKAGLLDIKRKAELSLRALPENLKSLAQTSEPYPVHFDNPMTKIPLLALGDSKNADIFKDFIEKTYAENHREDHCS